MVTMNSTVQSKVVGADDGFAPKLVYPQDSNSSGDTISILAPVESALLGLSEGDSINGAKPSGAEIIQLTTSQREKVNLRCRFTWFSIQSDYFSS